MFITELQVGNKTYKNVPSFVSSLIEIGLTEIEAEKAIENEKSRLLPSKIKEIIQGKVAKEYGVNGNPVSAALSIIGKVGDATSLNIDAMVHDIIAISETDNTDYSKARIRLFEEIHGENSWVSAVEFANHWHAGRKDKTIAMPFDAKGIAEVVTESAQLGGFVKSVIAAVMNQNQMNTQS